MAMLESSDAINGSRDAYESPRPRLILVLGIGNILLTDEGVGVHVIEMLRESFMFSKNVELIDGGTLGFDILDKVIDSDFLVVIDAVHGGRIPGTLYRLTDADLRGTLTGTCSLHEIGLAEVLTAARLLGRCPETVVLGVEPKDIVNWSTTLTETIRRKVPELVAATLHEIAQIGGECVPNQDRNLSSRSLIDDQQSDDDQD